FRSSCSSCKEVSSASTRGSSLLRRPASVLPLPDLRPPNCAKAAGAAGSSAAAHSSFSDSRLRTSAALAAFTAAAHLLELLPLLGREDRHDQARALCAHERHFAHG